MKEKCFYRAVYTMFYENLLFKKIIVGRVHLADEKYENHIVIFKSELFDRDSAFEMMMCCGWSWKHKYFNNYCRVEFYGIELSPML